MNKTAVFSLAIVVSSLWQRPVPAQVAVTTAEVHADRRVTFRLHAPNAKSVSVNLMGRPAESLTKGPMDVWSITVGPLAPELYSYTYSVDGALMIDPQNFAVKKWTLMSSLVEVPGAPPLAHELRQVPHGTLHQHWYFSTAVNTNRSVFIYTPPGYDPRLTRKYPVLFLLHGFGEDESAWTQVGRAHLIADNLLAEGRIKPMVMVMPGCHPLSPQGVPWDDYGPRNRALLEAEIFQDLLALLQQHYRVEERSRDRAITGLSMGGGQALAIGLRRTDGFDWVGGFSAAPGDGGLSTESLDGLYQGAASPNASKESRLRLVWVGCGKADFELPHNDQFVAWLTARNIRHTYRRPEGAHDWDVWRKDLAEFLPLLFK